MRVIGGRYGGTALRGGKGPQFRPTAQIVKGSVFDTLYSDVQDAVVLDLFAGSGALGIEALSRGAAKAVFVEQDPAILKALRTNLERCRIPEDQYIVHRGDASRFLEKTLRSGIKYDLIFADPPYASKLGKRLADMLGAADREICRMFIVETGEEISLEEGGRLEKLRTRKFGQTVVTYFRYRESTDGK
ncbi:MAG TPA: 16S rRNA (guanine(966)-N(2))-methyltransferase RsmD [Candidatus Krumholzibacterium sp.]|nr:16S rRNA (guanine(966)-N(2))-methyltransferase RsmD [Candidatus Krumholzibacterium sp.]